MIFVDTGGWYASVVPADRDHEAAARWLATNDQPLVTTDYVIDETLTLLRMRNHQTRAVALGAQFFAGHVARIHYLNEEETIMTWEVFQRFADKDWSFTDCSSKVVMERLGITMAFAFDHHFRQFGSINVVPR